MAHALPADIREISAAQVEALAGIVAGLSDADLVAPTRCAGWLVAHLLVHIRQGLVEHATACATPAGAGDKADRDYVSYWRDWPPTAEPVTLGQVRYYWTAASAYGSGESMRVHFADVARAAAGMNRQAPPGLFRFQGHVMDSSDILAMWTVEWVIHQLDLTAYLPGVRPAPPPEAQALTVATLDGLLGADTRPADWDDATYVLKGAGRIPLTEQERHVLGGHADRYPAFG